MIIETYELYTLYSEYVVLASLPNYSKLLLITTFYVYFFFIFEKNNNFHCIFIYILEHFFLEFSVPFHSSHFKSFQDWFSLVKLVHESFIICWRWSNVICKVDVYWLFYEENIVNLMLSPIMYGTVCGLIKPECKIRKK